MELSIGQKIETAKQFLREVKTELKKVTWPSRKDTLSGTAIVLVAVFIIAFFLGIVDSGLSSLIRELLKTAGG
jgi:preprotein translocase subunit SecE